MILCKKTELIDDLIDFRMIDLDEFFSEYKDKLEPIKQSAIEKLIETMEDDEKIIIKKEQLKILLYNNTEKEDIE
jgi:hypothetical protein